MQGTVGDRRAVYSSAWRSQKRLDVWGMNVIQLVGSESRNISGKEKGIYKGTKEWTNLKHWEDENLTVPYTGCCHDGEEEW